MKMITLEIVSISLIIYIILQGGINGQEYETYRNLDNYEISFIGKIRITNFTKTMPGNVEIIATNDEFHSIKLNGRKNGKYSFTITDEENNEYSFEYYYEDASKSIVLNVIK